jgi:hypothetical protein
LFTVYGLQFTVDMTGDRITVVDVIICKP